MLLRGSPVYPTAAVINTSGGVGIVLAILTIIVLVASAVAVVRASYAKAQIEGLRGDRDDLKERVERLESENSSLETENATLKQRVGVLERVVTGRDELAHLTELLETHHEQATENAKEIIRIVRAGAS